jgi:hypothetical protein
MLLNLSFQPIDDSGKTKWFVFDQDTGRTIAKDLPSMRAALDALGNARRANGE